MLFHAPDTVIHFIKAGIIGGQFTGIYLVKLWQMSAVFGRAPNQLDSRFCVTIDIDLKDDIAGRSGMKRAQFLIEVCRAVEQLTVANVLDQRARLGHEAVVAIIFIKLVSPIAVDVADSQEYAGRRHDRQEYDL